MISLRALKEKIAWRATAPSILLVLNSFVWYLLTYAIFSAIVNELHLLEIEKVVLFTTYFVSIAVSAILGSKLLSHARARFIDLWPFMGAIATVLLITVSSNGMLVNILLAFFLGASIGIGLPSCLSYLADSTHIENRGLIGGITWGGVGFTVLIFAFLVSMLGQWEAIVALTIWRLFGGVGFLAFNKKPKKLAAQKSPSYLELIRKREILLYLFPWVMFSLINFAEQPMLERVFDTILGAEFFAFVQLAEFVFIGIFAIIGGVVADIVGRKRVVITGFVMLGVEYAAMSVFSSSPVTLYLFLTLDGITWGLLFSVFFTVLWGDLGEDHEKTKYYVLGGLPYILANILPILISPYASDIPTITAFSFASFFLFLAVLPLMYAPETLPEKAMKDRDLKSYTEKALKKAQKEAEKGQKKHSDKAEKGKEEPKETPEDAEARKLAEKYY